MYLLQAKKGPITCVQIVGSCGRASAVRCAARCVARWSRSGAGGAAGTHEEREPCSGAHSEAREYVRSVRVSDRPLRQRLPPPLDSESSSEAYRKIT